MANHLLAIKQVQHLQKDQPHNISRIGTWISEFNRTSNIKIGKMINAKVINIWQESSVCRPVSDPTIIFILTRSF
jgi:hypothetical protein